MQIKLSVCSFYCVWCVCRLHIFSVFRAARVRTCSGIVHRPKYIHLTSPEVHRIVAIGSIFPLV